MKFLNQITAVRFCMSFRKYREVTISVNYAAVYTLYLRLHKKLILTAILLIISQIYLKIMFIQKIEKKTF